VYVRKRMQQMSHGTRRSRVFSPRAAAELKGAAMAAAAASSSSLNSENPYATIKDVPGFPFGLQECSYMEMKCAAPPRERAYTEISPPPFNMAALRRGERPPPHLLLNMLVHTCFLVFCWRAFFKLNLISTFLLRLKPKSQLETISRYFIFLNKCIKRLTSRVCPPPERQSSLGHAPYEDPQSHYDLPVNSHIPGHYDLPPVRRPPSPRRAPQWRHSPQPPPPPSSILWGWRQARAVLSGSCLTVHWGVTQHCPRVGESGTCFTATDLPSRLGSQRGGPLHSSPVGKIRRQKTTRLKAAPRELNMLQMKFAKHFAYNWSAGVCVFKGLILSISFYVGYFTF